MIQWKQFIAAYFLGMTFGTHAEVATVSLQDLLERVKDSNPKVQLQRLEATALLRKSQSVMGQLFPELGVEGGGRSNREKEKRNDHFYYAYGRFEYHFAKLMALRSALAEKNLARLAEQQVEIYANQWIAEVYYEALLLQEFIALKEDDFNLAEKQLVAARKRVEGGLATESDVLEFKMHQQELQNDLLILKKDYGASLRELERISNVPSTISFLKEEFIEPQEEFRFETVWKEVEANNLDLKRVQVAATLASSEKAAALAENFPRFSVEAQYGKLMETEFIESKSNSWGVVGKITLPLFSGGTTLRRYQEKSAVAERAQLLVRQEEIRLKNLIRTIVEKLSELVNKVKGEKENMKLAQKYFDLVMSEYRRGVKNSPDVASATDKLFEAKNRLIETQIHLSLTYIKFCTMQGRGWTK